MKANTDETKFRWFLEKMKLGLLDMVEEGDEQGFPMTATLILAGEERISLILPFSEEEKNRVYKMLEVLLVFTRSKGFCVTTEVWTTESETPDKPKIMPRLDPTRTSGFIQLIIYDKNTTMRMYKYENGELLERPEPKSFETIFQRIYDNAQAMIEKEDPPCMENIDHFIGGMRGLCNNLNLNFAQVGIRNDSD